MDFHVLPSPLLRWQCCRLHLDETQDLVRVYLDEVVLRVVRTTCVRSVARTPIRGRVEEHLRRSTSRPRALRMAPAWDSTTRAWDVVLVVPLPELVQAVVQAPEDRDAECVLVVNVRRVVDAIALQLIASLPSKTHNLDGNIQPRPLDADVVHALRLVPAAALLLEREADDPPLVPRVSRGEVGCAQTVVAGRNAVPSAEYAARRLDEQQRKALEEARIATRLPVDVQAHTTEDQLALEIDVVPLVRVVRDVDAALHTLLDDLVAFVDGRRHRSPDRCAHALLADARLAVDRAIDDGLYPSIALFCAQFVVVAQPLHDLVERSVIAPPVLHDVVLFLPPLDLANRCLVAGTGDLLRDDWAGHGVRHELAHLVNDPARRCGGRH
mmetsp:Transcript_12711/g.28980  ORF Transcript_12711/g.28980 Transcript_12711/m.28980 type:complete len:383 (-) Transcript_12711:256-1404(-)